MSAYNADIHETAKRDGTFEAVLRGKPVSVTSRDPEHDLRHAMVLAGLPEGSIQFWRGSTPSLLYRSVHRTAQWRVELGADFPYRLVRRREGTLQIGQNPGAVDSHTGETALAGIPAHPEGVGFPERISEGART